MHQIIQGLQSIACGRALVVPTNKNAKVDISKLHESKQRKWARTLGIARKAHAGRHDLKHPLNEKKASGLI